MGGAQLQAKLLLEELITRPNIEVAYITSRVNSDSSLPRSYQLIQVARPGKLHRYGLFWDWIPLQSALSSFRPHVIYQRVATAYTGISAHWAKQHQVPLFWHIANSTDADVARFNLAALRRPHQYFEQRLVNYGLANATHVVTQTKDQLERLQGARADLGKPISSVSLVRNFHPIPPNPKKTSKAPLVILWIANLKDNKRPELAVQLARELVDLPSIKIRMMGAPYPTTEQEKQRSFEHAVAQLPNLDYLGALPLQQVNTVLESADLLFNTSTKEGFSNTFIQAWFRCVRVLSLDVNPDQMLDGGPLGTAFKSISEMAGYIRKQEIERETHQQLAERAREIAIDLFSLENVRHLADQLIEAGEH